MVSRGQPKVSNSIFPESLKVISHQKLRVHEKYDRATPEKSFGVSLAYFRSLEGSQTACLSVV